MGGGPGFGRRSGGGFANTDKEEIDLSNLLALYNAVREDEKERDEKIEELDVSYKFLELCIELMEKKPKLAHKYIQLPRLISVIMFIAKTQHSYNDKVVSAFKTLLHEFFDRPVWTPLLKDYYLDFVGEVIDRVNDDSINRGEFLGIFKAIGKKAGGLYTELGRDLKSYARNKLREDIDDNEDDDGIDNAEDEDEDKENIEDLI